MIVLKRYWISITLTVVILILCFINPPEVPAQMIPMPNFDKLVHFLMFFGLSGVLFFDSSFRLKQKVNGCLIFWTSFLFPIVLGGGIEIGQECLTTTRSGDWMDFLFDVIGIFCALLICWLINKRLTSSVQ